MRLFILAAAIIALMAVSPAFANQINTSVLTEAQKAELALQAAKLKEANKKGPEPIVTVKEVSEWAELGTGVGKALAGTARELGVEVNNFAQTSVGKMSVFLVVWHFFGSMVIHVLAGISFVMITVPIWIWSFRKNAMRGSLYREHISEDERGKKVVEREYRHRENQSEWVGWHFVMLAIIFAASWLITFAW